MVQIFRTLLIASAALLLSSAPVFAQGESTTAAANEETMQAVTSAEVAAARAMYMPLAGLGAGLALIGGGLGIGRIGASAVESMARQPEVAGQVQTAMIIAAALIEGATFFALIVCLLPVVL